jgi:putative SOS response-associated peptidase YedK
MTSRYQQLSNAHDIAEVFRAVPGAVAYGDGELWPGRKGLVVWQDSDGTRRVSLMTWGFPLHPSRAAMRKYPDARVKPAHKAKGLTRAFWNAATRNPAQRCLIPVERYAEPERRDGVKRKTWFDLPHQPIFAWAGLWRPTVEWGDAYSVVMTEACAHVAQVHDRMPVVLDPDQWDQWLNGSFEDVVQLQRPYGGVMKMERSDEAWIAQTRACEPDDDPSGDNDPYG